MHRTVCGKITYTHCLGTIHNIRVMCSFPVCITGCGHIMYVGGAVTGLSQAWWKMNCLWFYATKRPLGTIRKSMDCLPSGFVGYIHRRRYISVVVDIYRLYATKGDIKHNQLNPSVHCIPKYSLPLTRVITRLTSLTYMYKKHPFAHYIVRILCVYSY